MSRVLKDMTEALAPMLRRRFEEQMVKRVEERAPELARVLGEERLRSFVEGTIERARRLGFTRRGPIRVVIDLRLSLGTFFDEDPQYPWVQKHIEEPDPETQVPRSEALAKEAEAFLAAIAGPGGVHADAALLRMRSFTEAPPPMGTGALREELFAQMRRLHPERAAAVGEAGLHALIAAAQEEARALEFRAPEALRLLLLLFFFFGRGCARDPLYPWIGATLEDEGLDPAAKALQLRRETRAWLRYVLEGRGLAESSKATPATGEWALERSGEEEITSARPLPSGWSFMEADSAELVAGELPTQVLPLEREEEPDEGASIEAELASRTRPSLAAATRPDLAAATRPNLPAATRPKAEPSEEMHAEQATDANFDDDLTWVRGFDGGDDEDP